MRSTGQKNEMVFSSRSTYFSSAWLQMKTNTGTGRSVFGRNATTLNDQSPRGPLNEIFACLRITLPFSISRSASSGVKASPSGRSTGRIPCMFFVKKSRISGRRFCSQSATDFTSVPSNAFISSGRLTGGICSSTECGGRRFSPPFIIRSVSSILNRTLTTDC